MTRLEAPVAPVSWGELLDKISILEIKSERIHDPAARANVARELSLLSDIAARVSETAVIATLRRRLRSVNERLWEIEDDIRRKEQVGDFGDGFVRLARSVYLSNDERAAIKREINLLLQSALVEEKSYASARSPFFGSDAAAGDGASNSARLTG
jgi:hypothetical protein